MYCTLQQLLYFSSPTCSNHLAPPEECHRTNTPPSPITLTDSQLELFEDTTHTQLTLHDSASILPCGQSTNIVQLPGSLMSSRKLARLPLSRLEGCRRVYESEEVRICIDNELTLFRALRPPHYTSTYYVL